MNFLGGITDAEYTGEWEGTLERVLNSLKNLRTGLTFEEYILQDVVAEQLQKSGILFKKEYGLAPGNRIDFFVEGGIGIEVKKGKPNSKQVTAQLQRYTSFDEIKAVILVVQRSVSIPSRINGKKCVMLGLNRLWGVALG